jgi:guanosine-3',5'-bis(diphosphate) 3'-pyrophosphohydrolase
LQHPEDEELLRRALTLAALAHDGQTRKFGPVNARPPYIVHPVRVMMIMKHLCYPVDVQAAALLHDVLEDCSHKVSPKDIEDACDPFVLARVVEMTNTTKGPEWESASREEKKKADRERLRYVGTLTKVLKLADRLDNVMDLHEAPESFKRKYIPETRALVELLRHASPELASRIDRELEKIEAALTQTA